jgi:predicted Zn-dependent protease
MRPPFSISALAAVILMTLAGCATPPPAPLLTPEEQIRQDLNTGVSLAQDFESRVSLKRDVEVAVYLRQLAQALADPTPELARSPLGVFLIREGKGKWRTYSLPGNRIYLPVELLRELGFENEIAALIAVEFGHLLGRDSVRRLAELRDPRENAPAPAPARIFGENGIFAFTEAERIAAAERAVDILYRAGYDPRGLVSVWQKYRAHPDRSPLDAGTLGKLQEATRRAIATRAPLRNPVVRSAAFITIQKRIRRL